MQPTQSIRVHSRKLQRVYLHLPPPLRRRRLHRRRLLDHRPTTPVLHLPARTLRLPLLLALEVLREIVPDRMHRLGRRLSPHRILIRLLAKLEKLLLLLLARGVPEAVEVGTRHGVDHLAPNLRADLGVLVKDGLVELVGVDARKTVEERADVGEAAGETETAAGGSVSRGILMGRGG